MASPLLPYANSRILVTAQGTVSIVDGRLTPATGQTYLVLCFMSRTQYSGVSSGSKKVPLESQLQGRMMPGASGDAFYYRGYALEYAPVAADYNIATGDESLLSFSTVTLQLPFLYPSREVRFFFGNEKEMVGRIERSSGIFGGTGIDEIIYSEVGGVQLQITGGELQS